MNDNTVNSKDYVVAALAWECFGTSSGGSPNRRYLARLFLIGETSEKTSKSSSHRVVAIVDHFFFLTRATLSLPKIKIKTPRSLRKQLQRLLTDSVFLENATTALPMGARESKGVGRWTYVKESFNQRLWRRSTPIDNDVKRGDGHHTDDEEADFWILPPSERIRHLTDPLSFLEPSSSSPYRTASPDNNAAGESVNISYISALTAYMPSWMRDSIGNLEWLADIGTRRSSDSSSQTLVSKMELERFSDENEKLRLSLQEMESQLDLKSAQVEAKNWKTIVVYMNKEIKKLVQTIRLLRDQSSVSSMMMGREAEQDRVFTKAASPWEGVGTPRGSGGGGGEMQSQQQSGGGDDGSGSSSSSSTEAVGAKDILLTLLNEKNLEMNSLTRRLVSERARLGAARRSYGMTVKEERLAKRKLRNLREDDPLDQFPTTLAARESLAKLRESLRISEQNMETNFNAINRTRKDLAATKQQVTRLQEIIDDVSGTALAGLNLKESNIKGDYQYLESKGCGDLSIRGGESGGVAGNTSAGSHACFYCYYLQDVYATAYYILSRSGLDGKGGEAMGWLKEAELQGLVPPTKDTTGKFYQLCNRAEQLFFPTSYAYLLVPGLLWEMYPGYFKPLADCMIREGCEVAISNVSGTGSVLNNVQSLEKEIQSMNRFHGKKVILIGHSKGGVDAAATLSLKPDVKSMVRGLITVQSPYAGAPLAEEALSDWQLQDVLKGWVENYLRGDWQSVEDLAYSSRKEFIKKHPFPQDVPVVSFHSMTSGISSTMMPLSAYHSRRYSTSTDGLVVPDDAEIPGSLVIRYKEDLAHTNPVWKSVPSIIPREMSSSSSMGEGERARDDSFDSTDMMMTEEERGEEEEEEEEEEREKTTAEPAGISMYTSKDFDVSSTTTTNSNATTGFFGSGGAGGDGGLINGMLLNLNNLKEFDRQLYLGMDTILGGKPRENGDSNSAPENVEEEEENNEEANDDMGNRRGLSADRETSGRELDEPHFQKKGPTASAKQIGDLYHVYAAMVNILVSETDDDVENLGVEDKIGNHSPLISPMSDDAPPRS
eukprot:jgi/Bigna1/69187/fgenesh1_pg.8_\